MLDVLRVLDSIKPGHVSTEGVPRENDLVEFEGLAEVVDCASEESVGVLGFRQIEFDPTGAPHPRDIDAVHLEVQGEILEHLDEPDPGAAVPVDDD